ncbi:MAG TPA: hypothetical protein PK075_01215 [Chitinophagales bacterium]|nr:hypothetical protein [Chitinophagales bacterium]
MNKETIGIINFIDSKEFEIIVGEFTKSHEKYYIDKILYDKDPENNIVKYTRHDLYRE